MKPRTVRLSGRDPQEVTDELRGILGLMAKEASRPWRLRRLCRTDRPDFVERDITTERVWLSDAEQRHVFGFFRKFAADTPPGPWPTGHRAALDVMWEMATEVDETALAMLAGERKEPR